MAIYLKRSWAEINLDALSYNVEQIKQKLRPGCMLLGVVKADAYGHGARQAARKLDEAGANWFGVSNVEEALSLRQWGIEKPILIFGTTPTEHAAVLAEHRITQTVYSLEYAQALQEDAARAGVTVEGHIKLDTGMTRLGFLCDEPHFDGSLEEIQRVAGFPNLRLGGVFTHFASADDYLGDSVDYTQMQFARFQRMTGELERRGVHLAIRHCANSAAVLSYPEMHLDMVRPGIILYGLNPSGQCEGKIGLKPVLELKSVIASVKEIAAGTQVSYGRIFTAPRDMKIAVVPIGYADGYHRNLSGKAKMLVNGQYAPVVGRVCMDQLMLDVTGVPDVGRGDGVTVIGRQGDKAVTADELAGYLGTINYEITCLLSKRIPRVYIEHGKEIGVTKNGPIQQF